MTEIRKYNSKYRFPNKNPKWKEIFNDKRLSPSSQFYLHKGKIYQGPPFDDNFELLSEYVGDYENLVKRFKKAGLWEDKTTSKTKNLKTYEMTLSDFMPNLLMKQKLEINYKGITKITIDEINTIEIHPDSEIIYFVRINGNDAKLIAEEFQNIKIGKDIENCILTIQNTHGTFKVKCETGKNGISNPSEQHYSYWLNIHVDLQNYKPAIQDKINKFTLIDI
ncbi:hypothetical protein LCGC14_1337020 [marine sediment metagenome]|uniref:Uncharacterized protein n=1 Tax=marine sediment metagenome TaxID=412755 RepID=A0A0F9L129_9ZZZZ